VYRRNVDGVRVQFENSLSVEVEERTEVTSTLDEAWKSL
jgi:hypothetical protein